MTALTEEQYQAKIRELEKEVKKLNLIIQKDSKTKYGLRWIDVPEAFEKESENKIPILEEVKENAIKNDDGKPTHILIEGDNYHALKCLNYTHKGKIDVIYIDPPYNTEKGEFIYKDKRVLETFPDGSPITKEHPLRHSSWLSFMNKRLELAKNLLSDFGIIFISIDDNEQANLKLLCDQIFGEANFIDTLMVEMSNTGGMKVGAAKKGTITKNGEFIHIYAKNKTNQSVQKTPLYDYVSGFDTHFNLFLNRDKSISDLGSILYSNKKVREEFLKFDVKIKNNSISLKDVNEIFDKSEILRQFLIDNLNYITRPRAEIPTIPASIKIEKNKWTEYFSEKREEPYFLTLDEKGEIIQLVPMKYNYRNTDDFSPRYGRSVIRGDYWKGFWIDMGNIGKEGGVDFKNGKKPIRLIKQLLKWSIGSLKNSTILDFFAGSGTTLHATIMQNISDNGSRQCILVQQNEKKEKICKTKTFVRCKNVMSEYGNSLKYYRTAFVGENKAEYATDKDKIALSKKAGCLLSMAENTLEEYVSTDRYQIFGDDKNLFTGIYFSANADKVHEFAAKLEQLRNLSSLNMVSSYFFTSGDGSEFADEFESLKNIKIKSIPEPILEIYRRLN